MLYSFRAFMEWKYDKKPKHYLLTISYLLMYFIILAIEILSN
ncbi:DUF4181 domain-containing protein [Bacillus methanolicus]|nr:DUF4181 domain-containing protein [Bacillus methanolicus]UQD52001.1 DUF4181 domain-containing protein [Bacillus methanolicus]